MARRVLNVFLKDALVGQLEQDDSGTTRYRYAREWLDSPTAVPLSASLPLRQEHFSRNETRPFFAGVLPEEDSRRLIAKAFGISDKNDFAMLERIGAECAGAVSLLPPEELPVNVEPHYREITSEELAAKLSELPRRPLLAGEKGIRLSLAGAQGKLALKISAGRFYLPLDGSPSSHIVKPQNPHFEGLVENEFFCMALASHAGLETARAEIGMAGDIRFLQVERYDRRVLSDGRLERIHQEDFCQALGIVPELKYQQEGGPNLKKCFELVRSVASIPGPDLLRLFDAVVFNFLVGNCDAHGKNFSFLREGTAIRLAPLYDLVSTQAYPELSTQMAMKIGGERDPQRVSARNWRGFFKEAGIGQAGAQQRLHVTAVGITTAAEDLAGQGCAGANKILPIIRSNHQRLELLRWEA
jgi:serine/threonine-protein kinase HipA